MECVTKTVLFNELKDLILNDGIELVKYKNGEPLSASDYSELFRLMIHTMIGVCVEKQSPIEISGLCKAGFSTETQNFVIEIDEEIQNKLRMNKSMICDNLLLDVVKEDVIFMLNDSKISEVLK